MILNFWNQGVLNSMNLIVILVLSVSIWKLGSLNPGKFLLMIFKHLQKTKKK